MIELNVEKSGKKAPFFNTVTSTLKDVQSYIYCSGIDLFLRKLTFSLENKPL